MTRDPYAWIDPFALEDAKERLAYEAELKRLYPPMVAPGSPAFSALRDIRAMEREIAIYDWRSAPVPRLVDTLVAAVSDTRPGVAYVDQPTDYQTALGRRLQPLVDRTMAILRRRGLLP